MLEKLRKSHLRGKSVIRDINGAGSDSPSYLPTVLLHID
jgi:hypothetical protein